MEVNEVAGIIQKVNGPIVVVKDVRKLRMMELVEVSDWRLLGEVLSIEKGTAVIQVYEDTSGVRPGDPVYGTGLPLSVELGPGIVGGVFDGIQRPLSEIEKKAGVFIKRGLKVPALPRDKLWEFKPLVEKGQKVKAGQIIGTVDETQLIEHRILVPPKVAGKIVDVVPQGNYNVETVVAVIENETTGKRYELKMYHRWPVKTPRPYSKRMEPNKPLLTGQRVIDTFFPMAKGGTAAIPGGFGTGKTITQHQLAKWSDAHLIVYIGCGERGNEITEVLEDFPKLVDPKSGRPLMERTILIANTSNMPVTAREASIYTGITIAEYFRDMGYDVAIMADSTSRWAEALRELSGRLEEMPAEEGFPAYLGSKLAAFYERAGMVETLSGKTGSVTVIGAVSPPGGDFSEPVTQNTKRFVRCFWELDKNLASSRHYPAINWLRSYSEYAQTCEEWWVQNVSPEYSSLRTWAVELLSREDRLQKIVKLVGPDALPQEEKLVLEVAGMLKDGFLKQSAYDPVDAYSTPEKQLALIRIIKEFYERALALVKKGVPLFEIQSMKVISKIKRAKMTIPNDKLDEFDNLREQIDDEFEELETLFGE